MSTTTPLDLTQDVVVDTTTLPVVPHELSSVTG